MAKHAVVIAGGGPTGLMLAGELALAGIDVAIVERRVSQELIGVRAGGLHSRTIEVLDQRGISDRFLKQGQVGQVAGFAWIRLDISDFPTRHNYGLALRQNQIERILAAWVGELAVPVYRGREVNRLRAGRKWRRLGPVWRPRFARGLSRRLRWRAQLDPQNCRHRLLRLGLDNQQSDRRGPDDRGAALWFTPGCSRYPLFEQS